MPDLQFSQIEIHYNYAFDLGQPINPIDAARRLLGTNYAGGFQNYISGQQEISARYRRFTHAYQQYQTVRQVVREIESAPSLRTYIKLLMTDPLQWMPVFLRIIPFLWSKDTTSTEEDTKPEGTDTDEEVTDDVENAATDFVLTILGRLAIQELVDNLVFQEGYLLKAPFARVSLEPFSVELDVGSINFNTTVTIHRAGIAILAIHGVIPGPLNADQVIKLQPLTKIQIRSCEIPAFVLGRYYSLINRSDRWEFQVYIDEFGMKERTGYIRFDKDQLEEDSVVGGLLDSYKYSIIEAVQGKQYKSLDALHRSLRSPEYFGYPIIFAKSSESEQHVKTHYATSLAKLILGFLSSSNLKRGKDREICAEDMSLIDGHSLYLSEGSALVIDFDETEVKPEDALTAERIHEVFMTTVIIDILILQREIVTIYDAQLAQATLDEAGLKWLYKIRRELLLALEEYEVLGLSHYGSVHQDILHGQKALRITDLNALFTGRLENIERLVQVVDSQRKSARDQFSRLITTLVSSLLSIPAANSIVEIVSGWASVPSHVYPSWIEKSFTWIVSNVKAYPTLITLLLYLLIFITALVAIWGGQVIDLFRTRQPAMPPPQSIQSKAHAPPPVTLTIKAVNRPKDQKRKRKR